MKEPSGKNETDIKALHIIILYYTVADANLSHKRGKNIIFTTKYV